jgi:hypothetical protein
MSIDSKAHVFVSHASEDKPFVRKLVEALRGQDLNVWLDEEELQVDDSIVSKVSDSLKETNYLVVVLSKSSGSSRWVQEELNAATARKASFYQLSSRIASCPCCSKTASTPIFATTSILAFKYYWPCLSKKENPPQMPPRRSRP